MNSVRLLDCTLRDGGYINDWAFGEKAIPDIIKKLIETRVDILELGFLKDEPYQPSRTVFRDMAQLSGLIAPKKQGVLYAAMIEVVNPIPLELLPPCTKDTVDIIRVIVWKTKHTKDGKEVDALQEGFEYCKGIVERGYKLCVQPARVDQYSDEEFTAMVRQFGALNPLALYVVDSWGTQYTKQLMHYLDLADKNLPAGIALGYHGHNNMMQAFSVAEQLLERKLDRDLILDASIYGIGRGAGNLNTELIAKYMNETQNKKYYLAPMMDIFAKYLKKIYQKTPWGYSPGYFMTACYNSNPNYASYYEQEVGLTAFEIGQILETMPEEDRIIYSKAKAERYLNLYRGAKV